MKMQFFRSIRELKTAVKSLPKAAQVWRGENGSYAVGDSFPLEAEDDADNCDYIEAGKAGEYRR